MRTADFDYELPPERIAQQPAERRDGSRLLVVNRAAGTFAHRRFPDLLEALRAGDVLVLNNSRVIPARLRAENARTGGRFEVLLLEENGPNDWWTMMRPAKRARPGTRLRFRRHDGSPASLTAEVTALNAEGHRRLRFDTDTPLLTALDDLGEMPLPPYIARAAGASSTADRERYQTVYAQPPGSVAAPTAGLHFTPELLEAARARGVDVRFVTLHVGVGTFAPVKADRVTDHVMHAERFAVEAATADAINAAKTEGRRVVAVGTTVMRVLESVAREHAGRIVPGAGRTDIFIHPPFRFRAVDALLTNFHLPRSTLLMLVSAFAAPGETTAGRDLVLRAYAEAVREGYRFFSYGDAMFLA
jgi:S-adenosylmethionine:tRNA ribosyltransferase-isomerase